MKGHTAPEVPSTIDVHHHFLPNEVLARLRRMAGGAPRLVDERISITLSPLLGDEEAHLEAMDAAGVDLALLSYSGVSVLGPDVCRAVNDGLAAVVAARPGRFLGAAHVALGDQGAPDELARCVADLGYRVVAVPCSAPGLSLDDRRLEPLWLAAAELDVPVLLHPALLPTGASTDYGLERSCGRPFDTTTAAVRLMSGVLPRHPSLRFVLPHCGGTAVFLKGRISMFFSSPGGPPPSMPRTRREQRADGIDAVFEGLWSRLWFDTAGTGGWSPAVAFCASVVGADRLMFGSDFPLESHSGDTLRELLAAVNGSLPADEAPAVVAGTAAALLGLDRDGPDRDGEARPGRDGGRRAEVVRTAAARVGGG